MILNMVILRCSEMDFQWLVHLTNLDWISIADQFHIMQNHDLHTHDQFILLTSGTVIV